MPHSTVWFMEPFLQGSTPFCKCWSDATDLHGIRAALQPWCLFTLTFNSEQVRRVKAEEAGGDHHRAGQSREPRMICVRLAPARVSTRCCSVKVCRLSGQKNWQARVGWEGDVFTQLKIYSTRPEWVTLCTLKCVFYYVEKIWSCILCHIH